MRSTSADNGGSAAAGISDVLRLAWPSVLSFVCNGLYRVNDQYWIRGLGPDAQAALGGSFFILVLNFALYFLAVAGSLTLIARATGARDEADRETTIRHSLVLGGGLAVLLSLAGPWIVPFVIESLGFAGDTARLGSEYLSTMYLFALPMAMAPLVDTIFIGMGNTRVPLLLTSVAVSLNFALNPCLIYGWGPFEARGMAGAALATAVSRGLAVVIGLLILRLRFQVIPWRTLKIQTSRLLQIARIGLPNSVSIGCYAVVYVALYRWVLSGLGRDVMAGLSIGFNAFEGISFPFFLGVSIAGSSLVGRNLGAKAPELALLAVRNTRRVGGVTGLIFALIFWFVGPWLVPAFTDDAGVSREAILYIQLLAFSQLFVAYETVGEKVLLGSGHTSPIFWVSVPGNALRVPLGWFMATHLGMGAAGVWWSINITTLMKAAAFTWLVQRGDWLHREPGAPESEP
ncbi:MAG: putative MATE family efflux protein [Planctomycetota bacterium]